MSKTVLITGASSGIGEATARVLAANGHRVFLGARRTERLEKIVADIRKAGGTAEYRSLDVANAADVQAFVKDAQAKFGRVDVMFNNAGVMPVSPMNALKTDEWDRIIDVNIKGVLNGIAAVLPIMEKQGSGHIISTASTGAHAVGGQFGVYCASKYAVRAIMEGLRQEVNQIRVTTLSPGVTESADPRGSAPFVRMDSGLAWVLREHVAHGIAHGLVHVLQVLAGEAVLRDATPDHGAALRIDEVDGQRSFAILLGVDAGCIPRPIGRGTGSRRGPQLGLLLHGQHDVHAQIRMAGVVHVAEALELRARGLLELLAHQRAVARAALRRAGFEEREGLEGVEVHPGILLGERGRPAGAAGEGGEAENGGNQLRHLLHG
jgi:NADP-dependent 3-hydroxy acid dehydrogenase YdfG